MSAPFKHPSVTPKKRGLYIRDWRGTHIEPAKERILRLDAWEPVNDRSDILFPGVWYVFPGLNDASHQALPWREPTDYELTWHVAKYHEARRWLEE
jgi:hypothetical protein